VVVVVWFLWSAWKRRFSRVSCTGGGGGLVVLVVFDLVDLVDIVPVVAIGGDGDVVSALNNDGVWLVVLLDDGGGVVCGLRTGVKCGDGVVFVVVCIIGAVVGRCLTGEIVGTVSRGVVGEMVADNGVLVLVLVLVDGITLTDFGAVLPTTEPTLSLSVASSSTPSVTRRNEWSNSLAPIVSSSPTIPLPPLPPHHPL